jgi:glycosyltransferase involved in cell wall biosynthesis
MIAPNLTPTEAAGEDSTSQAIGGEPPCLWMDVTTSWRARSGQMNGTLRVEQRYAKALNEIAELKTRFCRYDRKRQKFLSLETYPVLGGDLRASSRPAFGQRSSPLRVTARKLERSVRQRWRSTLGPLIANGVSTKQSIFECSSGRNVLLLAGENWSSYDFAVMTHLQKTYGLRIAVLCQDFAPIRHPQFFESQTFVDRFKLYADFIVCNTDLIIAISESTKSEIVRYAQGQNRIIDRTKVIKLGADLGSQKSSRPAELSQPSHNKFVLAVSTIQSRKNFRILYQLWHRFAEEQINHLPTLVIVGQAGFGSSDLLWEIAHDPRTKGKIIILHRANDEELAWLYQNCMWTLYPSLYEGWGLPISESLFYGKYCIASNSTSLPEAGAGLTKHIDPLDFSEWYNAIHELINFPERLSMLERKIAAEYQPMTWAGAAAVLANELLALR